MNDIDDVPGRAHQLSRRTVSPAGQVQYRRGQRGVHPPLLHGH